MAILLLLLLCLAAPAVEFHEHSVPSPTLLRGAAPLDATRFLAWGDGLSLVTEDRPPKRLARGSFEEGGCVFKRGLAVSESAPSSRFLWLDPKFWKPHLIDTGMDTRDCLAANLYGRSGILLLHHQMQVRFYEPSSVAAGRWPYQEVYSFYTASRQGGLVFRQIDGQGPPDIYAGNYWIRAPEAFDLPWRLFAINTYFDTPDAAFLRIVPAGHDIVVSQRDSRPARLTWFERPPVLTALWDEHPIAPNLPLHSIRALTVADLDGDGLPDVLAGEDNGPASRLILFRNRGGFRFEPQVLAIGRPFLHAWIDGRRFVTLSPSGLSWWSPLQ